MTDYDKTQKEEELIEVESPQITPGWVRRTLLVALVSGRANITLNPVAMRRVSHEIRIDGVDTDVKVRVDYNQGSSFFLRIDCLESRHVWTKIVLDCKETFTTNDFEQLVAVCTGGGWRQLEGFTRRVPIRVAEKL